MAVMITTEDNPFDPRVDFTRWYTWDVQNGYNTCAYLARVATLSEGMPEEIQDKQLENAVDEIIQLHGGGLYKKLPIVEDAA